MFESVQAWRRYWIATMPNGSKISQFDDAGKKVGWETLRSPPIKIELVPFSNELAELVRKNGYYAIPGKSKVISISGAQNISNLLAARDEIHALKQVSFCKNCGSAYFTDNAGPACPKCKATNLYVCPRCDSDGVVVDGDKRICAKCKSEGRTVGMIEKEVITHKLVHLYDIHYIARFDVAAPSRIEIRETDKEVLIFQKELLPVVAEAPDEPKTVEEKANQ